MRCVGFRGVTLVHRDEHFFSDALRVTPPQSLCTDARLKRPCAFVTRPRCSRTSLPVAGVPLLSIAADVIALEPMAKPSRSKR